MSQARRKWPKEVKLRILMEIAAGKSVVQAARENDLAPVQIYEWQRQYKKYGDVAFKGNGNAYTTEAKIAELERKVGQLTMENDLLKKAQALRMKLEAEQRRNGSKP